MALVWERQLRSKGFKLLYCVYDGDSLAGDGNAVQLTFGLRVVDDRPHQGSITIVLSPGW